MPSSAGKWGAMRPLAWVVVLLLGAAAAASSQSPVTRVSRPVRLLRSWLEPVKTSGGDVMHRVDILYDYEQAAAFERVYALDGRFLRDRRIVVNPPTPSPEEIEEAFSIVRADPEFAKVIKRFSAELEGGFLIEEGRRTACGPGARCLIVKLVSPDRSGLIRVLGVDLVRQTIPYRNFVPSEHPGIK
jgi:hypothetical protein